MGYKQQQEAESRHRRYIAKRTAALAASFTRRKPDRDAVAAANDLADRRAIVHASRQAIEQTRAMERKAVLRARGVAAHARHIASQQERKRQRMAARGIATPPENTQRT